MKIYVFALLAVLAVGAYALSFTGPIPMCPPVLGIPRCPQ